MSKTFDVHSVRENYRRRDRVMGRMLERAHHVAEYCGQIMTVGPQNAGWSLCGLYCRETNHALSLCVVG